MGPRQARSRALWAALAAIVAAAAAGFATACSTGATDETAVSADVEQLPPGPLRWIDADPAWSPDGRRIAFTRGPSTVVGDAFNIHWVDLRTGRVQRVTRGGGHRDRTPQWSPDAGAITFVRSHDSFFCNDDDEVYVVSPRGRHLRVVAQGCEPRWSPDGSRIAFLRDGSLLVVSADGARFAEVAPRVPARERAGVTTPGAVFSFDWSPDGRSLVFERGNELWVVATDGGGARRLTTSGYAQVAHGPRWSPDGTLILHDRFNGLWVIGPDGSSPRKIADGEVSEERAWSSDSSRIAFLREALVVVDRTGEIQRRLPRVGRGSFGGWAPDGRRLAVGGNTAGTLSPDPYPIVVVDIETGRLSRATQRPRGASRP